MGRKILITGAAGYVGTALADFLIERGCDVDLLDNYYLPSNFKVVNNVVIKKQDIRDDLDLTGYDVLVHLAGIVGLKACEERSDEAEDVNVRGTFNLLKTFKGRIIFASSSAVYGEAKQPEINENHPISPRSSYGATKVKGEDLVRLHGNYCILRFSNIYGKGLIYKRTVADCFIDNALNKKDLIIHGDGKQRRDFVHIKDVVKSYWYAINSPACDTFNIGGNEALNINDIAELVSKNHRQLFGITPQVKHLPLECGVLWHDFTYSSKKAKDILNYEPNYSIGDEIRSRLNANFRSMRGRKQGTSI